MNKSRQLFLLFTLTILAFVLSACASGSAMVQNWPGFTIDAENQVGYISNGSHVYAINLQTGAEKWRYPNPAERNVLFSAPSVLTGDSQLVVGGTNNKVYSLDAASGQLNWTFSQAGNHFYASGLSIGSKILLPNIDHNLYALDGSGVLAWKFKTGSALWSAPVSDGKLVFQAGMDHFLYALDPETGAVVWQSEDLGGSISGTPVLSPDGVLYFGTYADELLAVKATNGEILWRTPVWGWVYASPLLHEGRLYVGNLKGVFYAIDAASGSVIWQAEPHAEKDPEISRQAAVVGNTVFFGVKAGVLYALDIENGATRWNSLQKPFGSENGKTTLGKLYAPVHTDGETIYLSLMGAQHLLVAIDANGELKWQPFVPAK